MSPNENEIKFWYRPDNKILLVDITGFLALLKTVAEKSASSYRRKQIEKILIKENWFVHYKDKNTHRRVLSDSELIEHKHELITAMSLAQMNYDVLFAPKGMFVRDGKKFDIFLLRDTIILKADLKSITSKNPDTIAKRIIGGSTQASRVVLDINSDIQKKDLIDGLRSGVVRNLFIKEILLFYKKKFYQLPKALILSKNIFQILDQKK